MPANKVTSLSGYVERVREYRQFWRRPEHKELWFRGEEQKHETFLLPKLYRPVKGRTMKPVPEILEIENDLYEEFQHSGFQLSNEKIEDEDWDWYFLMEHHGAPTRLLDWSDGALMALHFALWPRERKETIEADPLVYVLEPDRLQDQLKACPEIELAKERWKSYAQKNSSEQLAEHEWERLYLPGDEEDTKDDLYPPNAPLLLEFPHITRRVAAQRSRFIVFGTDPSWLSREYEKPDSPIKIITIEASAISTIRAELRDCGVTESVIFPDLDGLGREMAQVWEGRK